VDWPAHLDLPFPVLAAAAQVAAPSPDDSSGPAPTRLRRRTGGWITVHASTLVGTGGRQVAVVLDQAGTAEVSSLILAAHGLTPAQTRVAALVVQGRSTRSIVAELHISSNTLQEHLRAVFEKLGIGSRRELVAVLSGRPIG
jgi:DNA-binding CsgD family transcriptional regulator